MSRCITYPCWESTSLISSDTCCNTVIQRTLEGVAGGITRKSARLAYCGLFTMSLLLAWLMRDFAEPLLEEIPWINVFDMKPSREWFGTQAVLRVSFGSFAFFAAFATLLIGVKDQRDVRDSWHHGGWMIKFILWSLAVVLAFFAPNSLINFYGSVARVGSGLFLLVVILLDFTYSWNEAWVAKDDQKWYVALLAISVGCYVLVITGAVFLFHFFAPGGHDCQLNIFFITMTLILAVGFAIVSLHPQVNGSLLPASVIAVYCVYLCWSALSSEPRAYACNGIAAHLNAVSGTALVMGMLTTLLSVVYSAALLSAHGGSADDEEADAALDSDDEAPRGRRSDPRPVRYVYSFFHVIFALASMYSAMLLTGWGDAGREGKDIIDVGWPSVYVKIASMFITAGLYGWSLVAPLLLPDRDFS
eukprot:jgi/Mesen1/4113/ME000216S03366